VPLEQGAFLDIETVDPGDLDRSALAATAAHWDWYEFTAPDQVADRIRNADVVITNKVLLARSDLAAARRLRLVAVAATGTNNVEQEAARDLGITVCNIRDYCSEAVAQHVIALMLNLLTGQPWYLERVRAGDWSRSRQFCLQDRPIREASGLSLGIIGYGKLGRTVAAKARALGLDVLIAERRGQTPREGRLAFEQVLRSADVLSIHCPLSDATRGLIAREELSAMKPGAILINAARGGIVDELDLAEALRAGSIGGAGVDTLSEEPPPADHPLLAADIPNLLVTPHNAWASREARQAALDQLAQVIAAFAAGQPLNAL
jgi:glycerate dehydrogenase